MMQVRAKEMNMNSEKLHAGRFIELLRRGRWEYAHRTGNVSAVGIIATTPSGALLLVEQFRPPLSANTIELPAGLVGDEDSSEQILEAAARELREETGFVANSWSYLYDAPSSAGLTDEMVHIVIARDLHRAAEGGGVAGEQITVHEMALETLDDFLKSKRSEGVLIDVKVRLAGLLLKQSREFS